MKKSKFENYEFRVLITQRNFKKSLYEPQYRKKLTFLSYTWYTSWRSVEGEIYFTFSDAKEAIVEFVSPEKGKILAYMPVDIHTL